MAHPSIKLHYFNIKVLGEPIRMILNYGGIPFEDIRVDRSTWQSVKPTYLAKDLGWGKMPVVEINGKELTQSAAICRYFAKQVGLVPTDDFDAAKCDEFVDVAVDVRAEWRKYKFEPDPVTQEELRKNFRDVIAPFYLGKYNKIVEQNDGKHLVGVKETWADFYLAVMLELFETTIDPDLLRHYPSLRSLRETVNSIPQIKAWIQTRPETLF